MVTAAPTLSFDFDLTTGGGRWVRNGHYALWSGRRERGDPPYVLHQWTEHRVRPFPRLDENAHLRRIPAGTPYHVSSLFGFWIVNDVDALMLTARRDDTDYHMLALGGATGGHQTASCLFVCPNCAAQFGKVSFDVRGNYEHFMAFAQKQVRAFNDDIVTRTCLECGHVNPPTYGFHAEDDTEEERVARNTG